MTRLLALLLLLLACVSADASSYTLGADGYYWSNGIAYTRTRYWQPGYGYGCHAVAGYYYWQYVPVSNYVAPTTATYTPDWKDRLLKIAEKKKDYEAFLQSAREFGLTVPYPQQPGIYGLTGYGVNATTQYGYGGQAYGTYTYQQSAGLDLNLLYQQAAQLAAQSQRLGGEATGNFQALAGQAGQNQARVAEILARGQMAAQVLAALSLPPTQETKSFTFKIGPAGSIVPDASKVPAADRAALLERWKELAAAKCLACHNAQTAKGSFNVGLYPDMTPEQKQAVIQSLTTSDEKKRMPRTADGSAGVPLTADELRLFLLN